MCVTAGCSNVFLFFQGTFVVSVPPPLPSRPRVPDVDSISGIAALNVFFSLLSDVGAHFSI